MMDKIDKAFWALVWVVSAGSWIAVQFFDWKPDPQFVAGTAFLATQFAASAKLDLFRKTDKPA